MRVDELAAVQEVRPAADTVVVLLLTTPASQGMSLGQLFPSTPAREKGHGRVETRHAPGTADRIRGRSFEDHAAEGGVHAAGPCQAARHPLGWLRQYGSCRQWTPNRRAGSCSMRVARPSGSGKSRRVSFHGIRTPGCFPHSMWTIRCRWPRPTSVCRDNRRRATPPERVILAIRPCRERALPRRPASPWTICDD
jgi:hypothetical protein